MPDRYYFNYPFWPSVLARARSYFIDIWRRTLESWNHQHYAALWRCVALCGWSLFRNERFNGPDRTAAGRMDICGCKRRRDAGCASLRYNGYRQFAYVVNGSTLRLFHIDMGEHRTSEKLRKRGVRPAHAEACSKCSLG